MATLEFIYDFVSVPCYLAWTQFDRIVAETGAELQLTPVFCGGIFKATGNAGPLVIPAKKEWYVQDLMMWAGHYGVPLEENPHSPVQSLPLMRGVIVAEERGERDAYIKAMFEAICLKSRNLSDADQVQLTLDEAALDSEIYFSEINRQDVKDQLRRNSEDAVERGVFGVPTFFIGARMFFGQDRLEFVKAALNEA